MSVDVHARGAPKPAPVKDIRFPMLPDQPHGEFILRVSSYNIQGLTHLFDGNGRYRDIGRILNHRRQTGTAPHIVLAQEAFSNSSVQQVRDISRYPYFKYGPPPEANEESAGLMALSEFPILAEAEYVYRAENSVGFDWNARKGIHYTKIKIPGLATPIEIFNTHMQADYNDWTSPIHESNAARERQQLELREFFRRTASTTAPVILVGDFNTFGFTRQFDNLERYTGLFTVAKYCLLNMQGCTANVNLQYDFQQTLDHQLYRVDPRNISVMPIRYTKTFMEQVNGRMLSDHAALEVDYKITW